MILLKLLWLLENSLNCLVVIRLNAHTNQIPFQFFLKPFIYSINIIINLLFLMHIFVYVYIKCVNPLGFEYWFIKQTYCVESSIAIPINSYKNI